MNPFIDSYANRIVGIALVIIAISLHATLLWYYSDTDWTVAFVDGTVSVLALAILGFLYGFQVNYLINIPARVVTTLLALAITLLATYTAVYTLELETTETFLHTVPMRVFCYLLCWIALLQWYARKNEREEIIDEIIEEEDMPVDSSEIEDRISVKDGSRIDIIKLDDIHYIQASGDYVMICTADKQYIKEQTMKYYEAHLPSSHFVRIHRSTIVNTDQIARMELHGKETYNIRMKNGINLRASITGYKLLKARLKF